MKKDIGTKTILSAPTTKVVVKVSEVPLVPNLLSLEDGESSTSKKHANTGTVADMLNGSAAFAPKDANKKGTHESLEESTVALKKVCVGKSIVVDT